MSDAVCPYCGGPLTHIDYYGEVLVGCVECNRWGRPYDKRLVMELMEDDLGALRAARTRRRKRRSPANGGIAGLRFLGGER
jgi:hypothetical protein